jgi:hypothetical protein
MNEKHPVDSMNELASRLAFLSAVVGQGEEVTFGEQELFGMFLVFSDLSREARQIVDKMQTGLQTI